MSTILQKLFDFFFAVCYYEKMENQSQRQLEKKKIIAIAATILIGVLFVVLIYNFIMLGQLSSRRRALEQQLYQLEQILEGNRSEIDRRQTSEYIERFARQYLDMIRDGDSVFVGRR